VGAEVEEAVEVSFPVEVGVSPLPCRD